MTRTQYYDAVMDELEKRGFNKTVNHYRPPIDLMSTFMCQMIEIGLVFNQTVEEIASHIENSFASVTEKLFHSNDKVQ